MDLKVVAKLHAIRKSLDDPAVIAAINRYDMTINYLSPEDYAKFVKQVTAEEKATPGAPVRRITVERGVIDL